MPQAAAWLGGLGLLPFVAGTLLILITDARWVDDAVRYYGASILSFMGGVQWGLAIADRETADHQRLLWRRLAVSVMPALIAWLAILLLNGTHSLIAMAAAFGVLLVVDLQAIRQGWAPAWYATLRTPLTAAVLACLVLSAWGTS